MTGIILWIEDGIYDLEAYASVEIGIDVATLPLLHVNMVKDLD